MAPSSKSVASRRKSTKGIVVLKLSPKVLQNFQQKLEAKRPDSTHSTTSSDQPKDTSISNNGKQSSKSLTPDQPDTPQSSNLLTPSDGSRKKSNKRANNTAFVSESAASKSRGKPGPKKKSKLYVLYLKK